MRPVCISPVGNPSVRLPRQTQDRLTSEVLFVVVRSSRAVRTRVFLDLLRGTSNMPIPTRVHFGKIHVIWNPALAKMISGLGLQKRSPSLGVGMASPRVIDQPSHSPAPSVDSEFVLRYCPEEVQPSRPGAATAETGVENGR